MKKEISIKNVLHIANAYSFAALLLLASLFIVKCEDRPKVYTTDIIENQIEIERYSPLSEWEIFTMALIEVESGFSKDALGDSGKSCGVFQIQEIYVRAANNVLEKMGSEERFSYDDRWSPELSMAMFYTVNYDRIQNNDFDGAIKTHNPGAGKWYSDKIYKAMDKIRTQERVRRAMYEVRDNS